jgi:DNA phosphorothioation-dependent restriction protein DptG
MLDSTVFHLNSFHALIRFYKFLFSAACHIDLIKFSSAQKRNELAEKFQIEFD